MPQADWEVRLRLSFFNVFVSACGIQICWPDQGAAGVAGFTSTRPHRAAVTSGLSAAHSFTASPTLRSRLLRRTGSCRFLRRRVNSLSLSWNIKSGGKRTDLRFLGWEHNQIGVLGNADEVAVSREQWEPVVDTGGGDQAINGSNLDPLGTTSLSEFRGSDIDRAFKWQEGKGLKQAEQSIEFALMPQAIEQFLKDIADQEHPIVRFKVSPKRSDIPVGIVNLPSLQNEGPDRGVNDEIHGRADLVYSPSRLGTGRCPTPSESSSAVCAR